MKPNLLKVIILILVIITMSFYSLKIKEDLLELERINSISDPDIKTEKNNSTYLRWSQLIRRMDI